MNADFEFNDWRAEWQSQAEPVPPNTASVRRNALKQQWRLRAAHVLELFSGVFFLVFSAAFAWRMHNLESVLWAAIVWLTTLIASAFSVWNWSALWKHDVRSIAEFSEVYEKRCRAKIRASRFGRGFVIVQALITGPWLSWDYYRGEFSTFRFGVAMLIWALLSIGFWVGFSRYRRSTLRELQALQATRIAA